MYCTTKSNNTSPSGSDETPPPELLGPGSVGEGAAGGATGGHPQVGAGVAGLEALILLMVLLVVLAHLEMNVYFVINREICV